MKKIVILDGYTLNPGDLSWEEFESLGKCTIYNRTPVDLIRERCRGAEIVITNKTPLNRETIGALPKLKYIGVIATGYNIVDVQAARDHGVIVTNVPTYGTNSVAQMVFALILELTRQVGHHASTVRAGRWSEADDWCYWDFPQIELNDLTLGLIGLGRIGKATANLADAFGMQVIAYDPLISNNLPLSVTMTGLDSVLRKSDIVSLHCPLSENNFQLINDEKIKLMKKSAFLINTSRGQLINDQDLAQALNSGRLAGAGIDVLSKEPPNPDNPLLTAKNCIITPHLAWATSSARSRLMKTAAKNLASFLSGIPKNKVY
jgi:glycerate dehydrogenase